MKPKKKPVAPSPIPNRIEFETFRDIRDSYTIHNLKNESPSCFNGGVSYRKFRVTIEVVEETQEVLRARIQKLWDENDNHHNWNALHAAAKLFDMKLDRETVKRRT